MNAADPNMVGGVLFSNDGPPFHSCIPNSLDVRSYRISKAHDKNATGPRLHFRKKRWLRIRASHALIGAALVLILAYFGGAYAMTRWFGRMPHNQITYLDLILPQRWNDLNRLRGQMLIEQSLDEFKANNFQSGFPRLRVGLARAPDNPDARLLLAQIYIRIRLQRQATKTLLDGLSGPNPGIDFLSGALAVLELTDNPEGILEFTQKAASLSTLDEHEQTLLQRHAIRAQIALGQSDNALAQARDLAIPAPSLLNEIQLGIFLSQNENDQANQLAEQWVSTNPKSKTALINAIRTFRHTDEIQRMQAAAHQLRELEPLNPALASYEVIENRLAGEDAAANRARERYLAYFGATPREIYRLGHLCANHGFITDIIRLQAHAAELGIEPRQLRLARLKAHRINHDWTALRSESEELLATRQFTSGGEELWIKIMGLLAAVCSGDNSGMQSQLTNLAFAETGSLELYQSILDPLIASARYDEASQIAGLTLGLYPDSRYIASILSRLAEEHERARALATAREEGATAPIASTSLQNIHDEINALREQGKYTAALAAMRRHRKQHPDLLLPVDPWAARQELSLACDANDLSQLQLYLRTHLKDRVITADEALTLAKNWKRKEQNSSALLAVREILRCQPDSLEALQTLTEWSPKPEPAASASEPTDEADQTDKKPPGR